MIGGAEIARNLQGAFRLAARDPSGLQSFDTGIDGFWRSFFAGVVALPFYVAILAAGQAEPGEMPVTVTATAYFLTQAIAYVCGWFAFPLAMIYVTRFIGREQFYVSYIIAANWCSVIPLGIFGVLALLGASGTIPTAVLGIVYFGVLIWTLMFHWFVARTALQINGIGAAGIVALDLLLGLMVSGAADAIVTQPM